MPQVTATNIKNQHHKVLLALIVQHAGKATQHTLLDNYLGNKNYRYPINIPTLRKLARTWMKEHQDLSRKAFTALLTSLIKGESSTEKTLAGILLDYSTADQRSFNPKLFNTWLNHVEGWAEIDTLCTGNYATTQIPAQWNQWSKLLLQMSTSKNITRRRASLVLLCSPLRNNKDHKLAALALQNVDTLKAEREILITKAISWVLRTLTKYHRTQLEVYMKLNEDTLPKIAVRETLAKLKTGIKGKRKIKNA
jgi:3-methyladenine DNA glycosylase AlkD